MSDQAPRLGDAIFGVVMLAVAVVVFATAWQLPPSLFDPLGPAAFPLLVSGLMAGLALILLGRLALGLATGRSATSIIQGMGDDPGHRKRPLLAAGLYALTVLYVVALAYARIGFLLPTAVYIGVLGYALSGRSRRDGLVAVAVAAVGGLGTWYLFTRIFLVLWP